MDRCKVTTWARQTQTDAERRIELTAAADFLRVRVKVNPPESGVCQQAEWQVFVHVATTKPAPERKTLADEIADEWGLTGHWRGGFYLASGTLGDGLIAVEFAFYPLIFAAEVGGEFAKFGEPAADAA